MKFWFKKTGVFLKSNARPKLKFFWTNFRLVQKLRLVLFFSFQKLRLVQKNRGFFEKNRSVQKLHLVQKRKFLERNKFKNWSKNKGWFFSKTEVFEPNLSFLKRNGLTQVFLDQRKFLKRKEKQRTETPNFNFGINVLIQEI